MATSYNPQLVVLGTDGTVVVGADPSLYFRTDKNQVYRDEDPLESEQELDEINLYITQTEPDELPLVILPSIHDEIVAEDGHESTTQDAVSSEPWSTATLTNDDDTPGVYGSVVFAELSCCFVAFIGYLVRSIPLWIGFSRGQKCCLVVAFSVAILYQFAALGWFFGAVTPEFMLGLSSLITRMISLGMVPITTTSFMGRAREICQDHATMTPSKSRKPSHSRSSRRHHARARSS